MTINPEQKIKGIIYQMSPEKRAEDFFSENFNKQWTKIPEKEKPFYIKKFIEYSSKPKIQDIENVLKEHEKFESKKFDFAMLFLGVFFGVFGNLIANLLDKYFSYLGFVYYIFIIIIFGIIFWILYHFLIRKKSKNLKSKENSIELLKLVEEVENYDKNI